MDKLLENEKRKNKSNKKILHDLFQPELWNLGQTINSKNIKKPYKTVEFNSAEMEKGCWATANLSNSNKQIIIN